MEMLNIAKELQENAYPGRGIIIGRSADGTKAVTAYFIMGRSENSRNRVFVEDGEGIRTQAFDESKLVETTVEIGVQVNGKLRSTIMVEKDSSKEVLEELALNEENVKKHIEDKTVVKVIAIPNRIVNIVVK